MKPLSSKSNIFDKNQVIILICFERLKCKLGERSENEKENYGNMDNIAIGCNTI